jgi:hypothetical protein
MYGLQDAGYSPFLFKIGKRNEKHSRDFGRGLSYANISLSDATEISKQIPSVITAASPKRAEDASALLSANAGIVIHDPTEMKPEILSALSESKHPIFTIRASVEAHEQLQPYERMLIPHPYKRAPRITTKPEHWAIAFSRLDWDKATHVIVEANTLLAENKRVRIHGALNGMYGHHKLGSVDPDWQNNYYGGWSPRESLWYGTHLAASAQHAVDLSAISGDGGGTQYSFLEAFDANRPLVINAKWLTGNKNHDEISGAVAATVNDANELAELLSGEPLSYDKEAAEAILAHHDAATNAELLISSLRA